MSRVSKNMMKKALFNFDNTNNLLLWGELVSMGISYYTPWGPPPSPPQNLTKLLRARKGPQT